MKQIIAISLDLIATLVKLHSANVTYYLFQLDSDLFSVKQKLIIRDKYLYSVERLELCRALYARAVKNAW